LDRGVHPGFGRSGSRLGLGARDGAVLHHTHRVRRRRAMRLVLHERRRTRPERERFSATRRLSARAATGDRPAPGQPVDARAGRPEERLRRDRRGDVQPRGRQPSFARLFAQPDHRQGRRHRSRHVQSDREPRRRSEPAAHRAVMGPRDALGVGRHFLSRRPRRRHADRPEDRQARQGDRRAGFLQPLLHPRRQVGDHGRRGDAPPRVPRSAHYGVAGLHRDAAVFGDQSCRFRLAACRRTSASRRTARCSSSPTS
jgi:hypothetical protein